MFRITIQVIRDLSVVTLDGRLADSDVEEVRRVLSSVARPAALGLSGLEICSEKAVDELCQWIDAGFTIQGATPFMRMLLSKNPERTMTTHTR